MSDSVVSQKGKMVELAQKNVVGGYCRVLGIYAGAQSFDGLLRDRFDRRSCFVLALMQKFKKPVHTICTGFF